LALTGWPKRTYCTHRLEKQAKRNLESKRIPRQPAIQLGAHRLTGGNRAATMKLALMTTR
jgi:hypothetical protein